MSLGTVWLLFSWSPKDRCKYCPQDHRLEERQSYILRPVAMWDNSGKGFSQPASQRLKELQNYDDQRVQGTMAYYDSPNLQVHLIILLLARPGLISAYNTLRLSILRAGKSFGLPTSHRVKVEAVWGLYHHCIILIIIELVSKLPPTTYA